MANNLKKVEEIVSAIHSKTISGEIVWEPAFGEKAFRSRFGNFLFIIDGSSTSIHGLFLSIKKIDGAVIATIPEKKSEIFDMPNTYQVSPECWSMVHEIFRRITSRDSDLDELVRLLI